MQLSITQFGTPTRKKTVIFKRNFDLCDKKVFGMTDFASLYIISIVNAFSNGVKIECPFEPRNFSIRSFTLNSEFVPFQMFYGRNSRVLVEGTFLDATRTSNPFLGNFFLNLSIEKSKME